MHYNREMTVVQLRSYYIKHCAYFCETCPYHIFKQNRATASCSIS